MPLEYIVISLLCCGKIIRVVTKPCLYMMHYTLYECISNLFLSHKIARLLETIIMEIIYASHRYIDGPKVKIACSVEQLVEIIR